MRNWQGLRVVILTMGILCLCQFSYAGGLKRGFKANQALDTTSTVTHSSVSVSTEVYDATGWNGSLTVPTKDAVRDKFEALSIVSPFTSAGGVIYPTTTTDNIIVGSSTNYGKVGISGDTDEVQLYIQGIPSQTNSIVKVRSTSTGSNLLTISNDGTATFSGTGTEAATFGSGSQATYVVTGNVSGTDTTLTFGSALATFSNGVTVTGATTLTGAATLTGGATMGKAITPKVSTLSDIGTVPLDLSLGNVFTLSATGNRTISAPTNPTAGQKFIIIHLASGGTRTLSVDTVNANGFRFGTSLVGPLLSTTSGKYDYLAAVVNPATMSCDIVAYRQGY